MADEATFEGFHIAASEPLDGFFIDFLGARTRVDYFPEELGWLSGQVFGFPERGNTIFFEFEEWQGVTAALREASGAFTCLELGCGWGPWLVTCMLAARQRGINDIRLTGVEAGRTELANLRTHFLDNGIDPDAHTILHAAVDDHDAPIAAGNPGGAPLICLNTLLAPYAAVDLIHCDIQFAEARSFRAGIGIVTERVKRIVVGTHSRTIEDELIALFQGAGWDLECEAACKYVVNSGRANLLADGTQVWKNSRL